MTPKTSFPPAPRPPQSTVAQLRNIHLHGLLGQKYGACHRLAVNRPDEAFRALFANFPAMKDDIRRGSWQIIRGDLGSGFALDEKTLGIGLGDKDLHIVPAPVGAKGGGAKIIIGAIIIIACIATMQFEGAGLETAILAGGMTYGQIAGIGAALAISGIAQVVAPSQKLNPNSSAGSNLFNGAQNTSAEGTPVPIIYGEIMSGSVIGSVYLCNQQLTSPYVAPQFGSTHAGAQASQTQFPGVQVLIQT